MCQSIRFRLRRCLVLTPLIGLLVVVARGETDQDRQSLERAFAKGRMTADAVLKGDFQTVTALTYPKVVELLGGREKEIAFLNGSMKRMKEQGFAFKDARVERPKSLVRGDRQLFAILPETVVLTVPDGTMTQPSYLLAISDDEGKSWTFIDGGTVSREKIRRVIPRLPEDLKLPEQQKALHAVTLTARDGRLELRLPDGWEKEDAKAPEIQMEAYNAEMGAALTVASMEKPAHGDFAKYAAAAIKGASETLKQPTISGPTSVRVGGHRTIRYELVGTLEKGQPFGFVITAIETETRFSTVLVDCPKSDFDARKDEFKKLSAGLTEKPAKR